MYSFPSFVKLAALIFKYKYVDMYKVLDEDR